MSESRLIAIEARLATLEAQLAELTQNVKLVPLPSTQADDALPITANHVPSDRQTASATTLTHVDFPQAETTRTPATTPPQDSLPSMTTVLGWSGAAAIVMAVVYFIRLSLDAGWLTPSRQCGIAALLGVVMVVAGLMLKKTDRGYASMLPAAGLVMWFLAIFGAHLYYHVIEINTAAWLVMLTSGVALWLGYQFKTDHYALFALFGAYSGPFLLPALVGGVMDLVIYFSGWSVLFAVYAVVLPSRKIYLLSSLLALITFHFNWCRLDPSHWVPAFVFQCVQFTIVSLVTWIYSVKNQQTLSAAESAAHLPALFVFYGLQYALLNQHLPTLAPWVALISAGIVYGIYLLAKRQLAGPLSSGRVLVSAYVAFVLFHAVYLHLISNHWQWFCGLLVLPLCLAYLRFSPAGTQLAWPFRLLATTILSMNLLNLLLDMARISGGPYIMLLYVVELYVVYSLASRRAITYALLPITLYVGHIGILVAVVHLVPEPLGISLIWATVALTCLWLAFKVQDKTLGQSALFILAVSVGKALLYDLSDAAPMIRIGCLFVLGLSLYAGGFLYKRVEHLACTR